MSDVDLLRRAAALMRERASIDPIEWSAFYGDCRPWQAEDHAYIASWHPTVALAVADLIDLCAQDYYRLLRLPELGVAVARAYLGEQ